MGHPGGNRVWGLLRRCLGGYLGAAGESVGGLLGWLLIGSGAGVAEVSRRLLRRLSRRLSRRLLEGQVR